MRRGLSKIGYKGKYLGIRELLTGNGVKSTVRRFIICILLQIFFG
jgi:hypothetical protein